MHWPYNVHQNYIRRVDVHEPFGGQRQSGIVTPKGALGIFIFTGHGGGAIGYQDAFQADGSLRYHAMSGKDLLVFEQLGRGGVIRFLGLFACAGWDTERQLDVNGIEREAIVFTLVLIREIDFEGSDLAAEEAPAVDLGTLRDRAIAAAAPAQMKQAASAATLYIRSRDVRD